jgi:putative oxidoreductase
MDIVFLIGRLIYGGFFAMSGISHFQRFAMYKAYAASKGAPAPGIAVGATGLLLFGGGLSIILGAFPTVGAALLIIFLLGVTPMMHNFWAVHDPPARMGEMVNFMKNSALLGAALMSLAIPEPWPLSVRL